MPIVDFGAAGAIFGVLCLLLINPTAADARRLDRVAAQIAAMPRVKPALAPSAPSHDDVLRQQPIFIMSVGANAYKERDVKLIGISVTPKRRAALVSVEGQPPMWMTVGDAQDELVLLEVGGGAVRFDTPVGPRTVDFNGP